MEHQKIINFLSNAENHSSKFRTKNYIEINYHSRAVYNTNSDIKFKTTILKSILCDYRDVYILFKGRIAIIGAGSHDGARQPDEKIKIRE